MTTKEARRGMNAPVLAVSPVRPNFFRHMKGLYFRFHGRCVLS